MKCALPEELNSSMRVLINIQSNDNEWFRKCLVRQVNPANKNPSKIRHDDRKLAKQLNLKGAKFPFHKKYYAKVEKQNNISIAVVGFWK